MTNKNVQLVYDTLLSMPGMNETVKIDLRPSRKLVLVLQQVVERGLSVKDAEGLVEAVPPETLQELQALIDGCVEKSQLTDFARKLRSLQQSKG